VWAFEKHILLCTLKVQWEIKMAGEIKSAMDKWKQSRQKLVDSITSEVEKQIALMPTIEADAKAALALPAAELNKTRAEINAIHEEFSALTNGSPAGPLPDTLSGGAPSPPIQQPVTLIKLGGTPDAVKNVVNELQ
jgi:hypothetical protein